ncbi:MAG: hypothetical protein LCH57_01760 [Proteobacteria bacterium]|nr:hypothetical protein [Pseudomonadota bacterium]
MRRPWMEGAALLAAHDHPVPPHRVAGRARLRAALADDVAFALVGAEPFAKPRVFPDIDHLARHVQRARGEQGLELVDIEDLECAGDKVDRPGVSIFATDCDGGRDRLIGHAWLSGWGVEHLKAALRRNRLVVLDDAA